MLPPSSQQYIFQQFPEEYQIRTTLASGETRTGTFDIQRKWADAETAPNYPVIALDFVNQGEMRTDDQPLSDVVERIPVEGDPTIAYEKIKAHRLTDRLQVTVATQGYHEPTETAARERMNVLASDLSRLIRFVLPDVLPHPPDERNVVPMVIPRTGISGPSNTTGSAGGEQVQRRTYTVDLNYTLAHIFEVAEVAGMNVVVDPVPGGATRVEVRYESAV